MLVLRIILRYLTGMNKCDKCGGLHWRTAPCVQPRVRIGTPSPDRQVTPKSDVSALPPRKEVHTQLSRGSSAVERLPSKQNVEGSNPSPRSIKSTATRKDGLTRVGSQETGRSGSRPELVEARLPQHATEKPPAGTQALPVDNGRVRKKALAGEVPSVNEQPETEGKLVQVQQSHSAPKFDKKAWMREYMREHRRGILRRPQPSIQTTTEERNDK